MTEDEDHAQKMIGPVLLNTKKKEKRKKKDEKKGIEGEGFKRGRDVWIG